MLVLAYMKSYAGNNGRGRSAANFVKQYMSDLVSMTNHLGAQYGISADDQGWI